MGLDLSSLVGTAFEIVSGVVDGVVESITFKSITAGYTVATGAKNDTTTTIAGVRAIRKKLENKDFRAGGAYGIPGFQIQRGDRIYLLPAADMAGTTPKENDQITLADGKTWEVVAAEAPPGSPLHTVIVRRPA